eukprot:gene14480-biopygen6200
MDAMVNGGIADGDGGPVGGVGDAVWGVEPRGRPSAVGEGLGAAARQR